MSERKMLTEGELVEIVRGLDRWHSTSPEVTRRLVDEVRALREVLKAVWAQVDDVQERIEKAGVLHN
jgi:hypothetical protein